MNASVAVIVLNYRTAGLTSDCLRSMEAEIEPDMQVIVVDNASNDGSADVLEELIESRGWSSWARVLRSPRNVGFAAGNNLGIRAIDAESYILLNSDTLIREGAFRRLREAMALYPRAAVIGPAMVDENGERIDSQFRFPGPLSELVRAANTGVVRRLLARFDLMVPMSEKPIEPDWLGFACVLLRRDVLDEVGLLDDGYFMYFEDIDYCRRVRRAGWTVLQWPASTIVHLLGRSSDVTTEDGSRARAPRYYYEARTRYYAKFYGRTGLLLANLSWCVGRSLSLARQPFRGNPGLRKHEALDIWTHFLKSPAPRTEART